MSRRARLPVQVLLPIAAIAAVAAGAGARNSADSGTDPTFHRDVAPLLQRHCQDCHRPSGSNYGGMRAPMSLVGYDEARPWAKSIAKQVQSREMPPWDAAPRHNGVFKNERVLTDAEISTLVRWAEAGAPAGNAADAPPPRVFDISDGWLIGEPDLVVQMPEPYLVPDEERDIYTAFSVVLTEDILPQDTWVIAFQCKPDSKAIHHFNLHLLEPGPDGTLPTPPPEFPKDDELAPQGAGRYMGGVSSGSEANSYPPGYGFLLKKGSRVTFDIHYHKEAGPGTAVWDRSSIGFKFVPGPLKDLTGGLRPLMKFDFAIPPGADAYQLGPISQVTQNDVEVVALMPHMHMRGKAAKFEAFYPDGTSEVLLDVPAYDFEWQTVYYYRELKLIPKGTRVEYTAWYENSPEKGAKYGFDATETVRFGQPSDAEMMMGFFMSARAED